MDTKINFGFTNFENINAGIILSTIFGPVNDSKYSIQIFCLVRAIARAHASTRATGLMHVKNSMHHFYLWHFLPENTD